jgi:hypothetical protein
MRLYKAKPNNSVYYIIKSEKIRDDQQFLTFVHQGMESARERWGMAPTSLRLNPRTFLPNAAAVCALGLQLIYDAQLPLGNVYLSYTSR